MSIPLLWRAHSGLSKPVFGVAMGPFRYVDIVASVGPFRIIDIVTRWRLWAHSCMSIPLLWWAHSGLSTPVFGGGYGPIQVYRRCCFGGPIHDYRRRYSAVAMGPFMNVDTSALAGPLRIIEAGIRRGYGPIQVCRHCFFGGPTQDYRRRYSALAMGPFRYIDVAASVGPFTIIDFIILQLLWAHLRISTSASVGPLKIIEVNTRYWLWAHSRISAAYFCTSGRPTQQCRRRISMGLFEYIDGIVLH